MMTNQQLTVIASRAMAATPVEWLPSADSDMLYGAYLHAPQAAGPVGPRAMFTERTDEYLFMHARADILALVAELRRACTEQGEIVLSR